MRYSKKESLIVNKANKKGRLRGLFLRPLPIAAIILVLLGTLVLPMTDFQENQSSKVLALETTEPQTMRQMATELLKKSGDVILAQDPLTVIEENIATYEAPFTSIPYTCSALFKTAKKFEVSDPERAAQYRAYGVRIADFLVRYRDMDNDGKIGWGASFAWDAFQDNTVNPAHTEYAFQTPIVIYCLADAYEATSDDDYLVSSSWAINHFGAFGTTNVSSSCSNCYYYWYSHSPYDKGRFVKNTNVLMGLGIARWAKIRNNSVYLNRANQIYNAEKWEIDTKKNFAYLGMSDPKYKLRRDSHIWTEIFFADEAASLLGKTDNVNMLNALRNDFWACAEACNASTSTTYGFFTACIIAYRDSDSRLACEKGIKENAGSNTWDFAMIAIAKSLDSFDNTQPVSLTPTPMSVTWTSVIKATNVGEVLTKTSTATAWDSGARSSQTIFTGDGYAEITISDTVSKNRCFGLNHNNTTTSYTDIDHAFCFSPNNNGVVYIYENGINKNATVTQAIGDTFKLTFEAGTVRYLKNGQVFYTSTQSLAYPTFIDVSLYQPGTKIPNAKLLIDF